MKKEYSLAHLTAISTTPLELVKIAVEAGYDYVSIRQIYLNVKGEVICDLSKDYEMLEEIETIMEDTGIRILDIELAKIYDNVDISSYEKVFKIGKRLGAKHILSSIWTERYDFATEKFAELCDLANKYDLTVNLEAVPIAGVRNLNQAMQILKKANRKNSGLMIDTHHFQRAQDDVNELAKIPNYWFNYSQICDATKDIPKEREELIRIMRDDRDYLGYGGIDVGEILNAMPVIPYSIELPKQSVSDEYGYLYHAKKCLETAKEYCEKKVVGRVLKCS